MREDKQSYLNCKCLKCGLLFHLKPFAIKRGRGKYCSKKCKHIDTNKHIKRTCCVCSTKFMAKRYIVKKGRATACSTKCAGILHKGEGNPNYKTGISLKPKLGVAKGKRHWNWQGGKTIINTTVRMMPEYKKWRESVFERDDYTCQFCNIRGSVTLNADHIIPLRSLIVKYKIKTRKDARRYSELWNINNGRTLCLSCHSKTKTYGWNLVHNKQQYENA